jgi:hypothetical protein
MTPRRRRALAAALGALVAAVVCAVLSSNVEGAHRAVLLVLTALWLLIAASCVVNALRTAPLAAEPAPLEGAPVTDTSVAGPVPLEEAPVTDTSVAGPVPLEEAPVTDTFVATAEGVDDPA